MAAFDDTEDQQDIPTPPADTYTIPDPVSTIPTPPGLGVIPQPPEVITPPPDLSAAEQRYEVARGAAQRVADIAQQNQSIRNIANQAGASVYIQRQGGDLNVSSSPEGTVQYDEFGIRLPSPPGSVGIQGVTNRPEIVDPSMISPEGGIYADTAQRDLARRQREDMATPTLSLINRSQQFFDQANSFRDQRVDLEARRNELQQQLRSAPAGRRGQVSPQARAAMHAITSLNQNINNLVGQERQYTAYGVRQSAMDTRDNNNLNVQRQTAQYMQRLDANPYPAHSREWDLWNHKAIADYPDGAKSQQGRFVTGKKYGEPPPPESKIRAAVEAYRAAQDQGLQPTGTIRAGGISARVPEAVQAAQQQKAQIQERNRLASTLNSVDKLTPDQLATAGEIRATNAPLNTADQATVEQQRHDNGQNIAFRVGTENYLMDRNRFDATRKAFGQEPSAAPVATPTAQPSGTPSPARSPQDQQAIIWANANPDDPRAAQIRARLGVR